MWWALGALSDRLGTASPLGAPVDEVTEEDFVRGLLARSPLGADAMLDAGPRGIELPVEYGWVRDTMLVDGHWQIAPTVAGRAVARAPRARRGTARCSRRGGRWPGATRCATRARAPSPGCACIPTRPRPRACATATGAGRERARLARRDGARSTPTCDADVASVTHGRRGPQPRAPDEHDHRSRPLTGMPHASGVPVTRAALGRRAGRRDRRGRRR